MPVSDEEVARAVSDYNTALRNLSRAGAATAVSKRNGVEATYGAAYQRLVKLDVKPQIRGKYRRFS